MILVLGTLNMIEATAIVMAYLLLSHIEATILYPYTAERRDVLGNTSPEAREIS